MKKTEEVQQILNLIDDEMKKISEMIDFFEWNDNRDCEEYIKATVEIEVLEFMKSSIYNLIFKEIRKNLLVESE